MNEKLLVRLKEILIDCVKKQTVIEYGQLSKALNGAIPPIKLNEPLGEVSYRCIQKGFPPLSVLVVNRDTQRPGEGFFTWVAAQMGYPDLPGSEWENFFQEQFENVINFDNWDEFLQSYQKNQGKKLQETQNNTWIFQGNPIHFRINDYLSENTNIIWNLKQEHYQNKIKIGDKVYIWRSDGGQKGTGGVIAKGKITGVPFLNNDPSPYWNNTEGLELTLKVPIEIIDSLLVEGFISRQELLEHPKLKNLLILKMSNQTNYLVNKDQVTSLDELWKEKMGHSAKFNQEKFNSELSNKDYVKGQETPFYVITVKKFTNEEPFIYDVLLIENHQVVSSVQVANSSSKNLFAKAKQKALELLFAHNPDVNLEDVSMIHYQVDSWIKEPRNSFSTLFNKKRLHYTIVQDLQAEKSQYPSFYKDGEVKQYYGNRYERKATNRLRAIEIHGTSCMVCGFNYEEVYGEHGKDFIEVHHVKPLSTLDKAVEIDPEKDLAPVCANCHRMLHRKRDHVLSIEELKAILKK